MSTNSEGRSRSRSVENKDEPIEEEYKNALQQQSDDERSDRHSSPEIYRDEELQSGAAEDAFPNARYANPRNNAKARKQIDRPQSNNGKGRAAISRRGPDFQTPPLVVKIEEDDASFILGRGGKTKQKLARVSGSEIVVTEDDNGKPYVEVYGPESAKEKAKCYIEFVVQQRRGVIDLDTTVPREDLTVVDVPNKCIGYVTGRRGVCLRAIEEEWNTLMFFINNDPNEAKSEDHKEKLAIFGTERSRKGAEFKIMSAVEQKEQGNGVYTSEITEDRCSDAEGFDTDIFKIDPADYSYVLGRHGNTRKKLAKASGAILEYVGNYGFVAGTKAERARAYEYFIWLKRQRVEAVSVDVEKRSDAVTVKCPSSVLAAVTGKRGANLRIVEADTGTFIFVDGEPNSNTSDGEDTLLVFSHNRRCRENAVKRLREMIQDAQNPRDYHRRPDRYRGERGDRGVRGDRDDRGDRADRADRADRGERGPYAPQPRGYQRALNAPPPRYDDRRPVYYSDDRRVGRPIDDYGYSREEPHYDARRPRMEQSKPYRQPERHNNDYPLPMSPRHPRGMSPPRYADDYPPARRFSERDHRAPPVREDRYRYSDYEGSMDYGHERDRVPPAYHREEREPRFAPPRFAPPRSAPADYHREKPSRQDSPPRRINAPREYTEPTRGGPYRGDAHTPNHTISPYDGARGGESNRHNNRRDRVHVPSRQGRHQR